MSAAVSKRRLANHQKNRAFQRGRTRAAHRAKLTSARPSKPEPNRCEHCHKVVYHTAAHQDAYCLFVQKYPAFEP